MKKRYRVAKVCELGSTDITEAIRNYFLYRRKVSGEIIVIANIQGVFVYYETI